MQHANAVAPVATQPLINYNALPGIPCPICASEKYEIVTLRFDGGRIVQCLQCGHKYLNPTLTDDILKAIYTDYHEAESDESVIAMVSNWFAQPDSPYQYVLQKLELDGGLNGKRVVEVGCGPGKFLNECRLRGAIVAGVDISPGAVRMAKNFF
ncbi:MAG TPA: methyltransferase domain-containing protein, partial [Pyrinomonadaceae bacterium]